MNDQATSSKQQSTGVVTLGKGPEIMAARRFLRVNAHVHCDGPPGEGTYLLLLLNEYVGNPAEVTQN